MRLQDLVGAVCLALVGATLAVACNIPVFRYALERWRPDALELFVYHVGENSAGADLAGSKSIPWKGWLGKLTENAANLKVTIIDVSAPLTSAQAELRSQLGIPEHIDSSYVALRGNHVRGPFTCWSGPLSQAEDLVSSPARAELSRRLLAGHAMVWLLIRSSDVGKNRPIQELLKTECKRLSEELELPEGIGLPGSELYSEVPLLLEFSTLEIERSNAREAFLLKLGEGLQPEAFAKDEPLVIPVFGRGRALEVLPGSRLSPSLIKDITMFLCGACSCQVKEQNPGFDLLMATDWEQELFGENGSPAPPADSIRPGETRRSGQAPVLLTIPPGRSK